MTLLRRPVLTITVLILSACRLAAQADTDKNQQFEELRQHATQLLKSGSHEEGVREVARAMAYAEQTYGPESEKTEDSALILGVLCLADGNVTYAAPLFLKALELHEKRNAPDAKSAILLSFLGQAEREFKKAEADYLRGLEIIETTEGTVSLGYFDLLRGVGFRYRDHGDYDKAESAYQQAITIGEKLGIDNGRTANALDGLGEVFLSKADYAEAEVYFSRAVSVLEKAVATNQEQMAGAIYGLAESFRFRGSYDQAEAFYKRALEIYDGEFQQDGRVPYALHTANSLERLALVHLAKARPKDAETELLRAVVIFDKVRTPDSLDAPLARLNLSVAYQNLGDYKKAESVIQNALTVVEGVVGKTSRITADFLIRQALVSQAEKDYAKAEVLLQRALGIFEEVSGSDSPETAKGLQCMADNYRLEGEYGLAEAYYAQALSIRDKGSRSDKPETADSLNNLALVYQAKGEYGKAEPLLLRSISINERTRGPDHPETATATLNLAENYRMARNYTTPEPLYRRALSIRETKLGPDHPDTALALNDFGLLLQAKGDFKGAEPLLLRAVAINDKIPGRELDTAANLLSLAENYRRAADYKTPEPLYQRALSIREMKLGPDHPDTALALNYFGLLFQDRGEYKKAEPMLIRAVAIDDKIPGEKLAAATSLLNLAGNYRLAGDYKTSEPLYQRALSIRGEALGPDHRDTADALNGFGMLLTEKGDYKKADSVFLRALAIRQTVLGRGDKDTLISMMNLAFLRNATGDYAKAEGLLASALDIMEKTLGPDDLTTAAALNSLGMVFSVEGNYVKAQAALDRALAIKEKTLGPDHLSTAQTMHNSADLLRLTGEYGKAESLETRSLAIIERIDGPNHRETAIALESLGQILEDRGEYNRAEELLRRALATIQKVYGPEHPETAIIQSNLSILLLLTGRLDEAEGLSSSGLAIMESSEPNHPQVAKILSTLGHIMDKKGDYVKAAASIQHALVLQEAALGSNHPDTGVILVNLSQVYLDKGDYAGAEASALRAFGILEKSPYSASFAGALNALAAVYQLQGKPAEAEKFCLRALQVSEQVRGKDHPDVANNLNNLASIYLTRGNYQEAQPLLLRAVSVIEQKLGPEDPQLVALLSNLAWAYQQKKDYERAEGLYLRSLTICEKTHAPEHPDTAVVLNSLAQQHWLMGKYDEALNDLTRANRIEEKNLGLILSSGSERQKVAYLSTLESSTDVLISFSAQAVPLNRTASRLALNAVIQRKARVLDSVATDLNILRQRITANDRGLLDQLIVARRDFAARVIQGSGKQNIAEYKANIGRLQEREENLEAAVSARSVEFRAALQSPRLDDVQASVPKGSAVVEFARYQQFHPGAPLQSWGAEHYIAYILFPQGDPAWVDLGEQEPIDKLCREFRRALDNSEVTKTTKELARDLNARIMRPIRDLLSQTTEIFLAPEGELNQIPFAALMDGDRYLVERFQFTYLSTGRDLLKLRESSPSRHDAVIFANPDFGSLDSAISDSNADASPAAVPREFAPLPGTAIEGQEIRRMFPESTVFQGRQANKDAFMRLAGPVVVHVATHGYFRPDAPKPAPRADLQAPGVGSVGISRSVDIDPMLRSGLVLAGANRNRGDGIITAAELATVDLRGTQLVVLSACDTGVGEVRNGDGVMGLRRALVLAGVRTQLVSLWKVQDEMTRKMMSDYYRIVLSGRGRSAALREVQRAMIANGARPEDWAAFVPVGDPTPMPRH